MTALRHQVGRLLIAGLESFELSALERSWMQLIRPAGLILFRRNIDSAQQAYQLLRQAETISGASVFRCVDLEGGLVDRLRDAIAPMPSAAAIGASRNAAVYRRHGVLIGEEARLCGFNVVLAPVLDLALPESQSVMRSRTYFAEGAEVAEYARKFLEGVSSAGVLGCGKHFPGLGGGDLDSHQSTPVIQRNPETLWKDDLLPYRLLKSVLPMVMISHGTYPRSGYDAPASVSHEWITDTLVRRIGYRGLIVSDDMEMGGILGRYSIEDAVLGAVYAGAHLIEICKEPAMLIAAYEALLTEAERSPAFRAIVEQAFRKVLRSQRLLEPVDSIKQPSVAQVARVQKKVVAFRGQYPEPATRTES